MRWILPLLLSSSALGQSEVVFPPQSLPIQFSHRQHLAFKLQCDFCHDRAESSTSSQDDLVPSEESCRTCHKIDRKNPLKEARPAARCDACHVETSARVAIPPPHLKFNHKIHIDQKIPCQRCHGDLLTVDLATRAQLPRMELCLGCHNSTAQAHRAPAKCSTCHLVRADNTLQTDFDSGRLLPSGTLKGDAHTPQFSVEHGRLASQEDRYCAECHRRDFCNACHNGAIKPMRFHGNDYLSLHAIDARKQAINCDGCHRKQSFCLGCHERSGVTDSATTPANPSALPNLAKRFHPPYEQWVVTPRGPLHHSWQAERNIRQCVACHREDTCLQCHTTFSSGGQLFNVNPHPAGFASSRMCQSLASRNARVCLKCHTTSDARLNCR